MLSVYRLTLRQLSSLSRIGIMIVLAAMPIIIAAVVLSDNGTMSMIEFEQFVLSTMLAGSIVPLAVLAIATSAFANEIEDRTLANLTLSPISRWRIAAPKLLAAITIAAPLVAISALVTTHIAFLGEWNATIAVTVGAIAAVVMYSSLFVWLGLANPQSIGVGLLYIVLWEGFFAQYVAGVRLLSIRYYAVALMHGLDERRFAVYDHASLGVAITMSLLVTGGFLFLAIRRLKRMDVP
jgi:ABC-type transport system involved in multi-copper enzyme maturation permease subunit